MGKLNGYKKGTRKVKHICRYCGKEFESFISKKAKFCSRRCFYKSGVARLGKKHNEKSKEKIRRSYNPNSKKTQFQEGHKFYKGGEKGWFKKGHKPKNWQGGKRPFSQTIKDDVRYKKWRKEVFIRDNYTCQKCKKRGGYLHPHHIEAKSMKPELAYDIENGVTLCQDCHRKFHKKYGFGKNTKEQFNKFLKKT